jgi:ribosomal small subunit protein bTHX
MGKGDKRTKRGKIFKGSYGKSRPHDPDKKKAEAAPRHRPPRAPSGR